MKHNRSSEKIEKTFTQLIEQYAVELPERLTLESKEDFIYLSDLDTYEIYLISMKNPAELREEWRDYKGKKCYELLQNRSEPCPFCTNHLLERDMDYIWKKHNPVVNVDYILKDRLVEWQGKMVRMEVVINVSDSRRIDIVLQRSLATQNILTGCLRHLIQIVDLEEGCRGVLQKLVPFFGAKSGFVQYFGELNVTAKCEGEVSDGFKHAMTVPSEQRIERWSKLLAGGRQIIIKNIEDLRDGHPESYQFMKEDGIHSLCITPICVNQKLCGFIYIGNITTSWTEVSMLTTLSGFLSMMLQKNSLEQEKLRLQYYDDGIQCMNFEGFRKGAMDILHKKTWDKYALLHCDIKSFKYINDVFGYDVGDMLLQHWAYLLEESMQQGETFGRVSGDNFIALIQYENKEGILARFSRMAAALTAFMPISEKKYRVDVACGVFLLEEADLDMNLDEMLNRANMAQKSVKAFAGSRLGFYDETMRRLILKDLQMESEIQDAIKNGELIIYLQPQSAMSADHEHIRAEALVRWRKPDGKIVPPGEFIDLFEKDGMIVDVDRCVLEQACKFQSRWIKLNKPSLCLAVNVSRISMLQPTFVEDYQRIKDSYGIPDGCIELEFTETLVVTDYEKFRDTVVKLKKCGFFCAMDDFGSCQSSLNLLKNLPLDVLKMDRMFFMDEVDHQRGLAVVECVLQLAKALCMQSVAEGIENMQMVEDLRRLGCDFIQGYVFARPMPAEEFFLLPDEELNRYGGKGR